MTNDIQCLVSCDTNWNNIDTMQLYRMQTGERIMQNASSVINRVLVFAHQMKLLRYLLTHKWRQQINLVTRLKLKASN